MREAPARMAHVELLGFSAVDSCLAVLDACDVLGPRSQGGPSRGFGVSWLPAYPLRIWVETKMYARIGPNGFDFALLFGSCCKLLSN
jgi:hypothetical protein